MARKKIYREGFNGYTNSYWPEDPLSKEEYAIGRANGISTSQAYTRRHSLGWPKKDCITKPMNKRNNYGRKKIIEENREKFESLGIPESMFKRRVFLDKYTPEEFFADKSLWVPKRRKPKKYKFDFTKEQLEIAAMNDIGRSLLTARMSNNWSIERAMTEAPGASGRGRKAKEL